MECTGRASGACHMRVRLLPSPVLLFGRQWIFLLCFCLLQFRLTWFLDLSHTRVVRPGCIGNRTRHRNEGSLVCAVVPAKHLNVFSYWDGGVRCRAFSGKPSRSYGQEGAEQRFKVRSSGSHAPGLHSYIMVSMLKRYSESQS